jgi:nicotinamidase-related amidase
MCYSCRLPVDWTGSLGLYYWPAIKRTAVIRMSNTLLSEYTQLLGAAGATIASTCDPISSDDVVIIVDMQIDFLPGGNFGVAEGDQVIDPIVQFARGAATAGARVFATRDYHPADHCSFNTHGGPFPSHCVQNSAGSKFAPPIAHLLTELSADKRAQVVFKGFSKDVDSFGGFRYPDAEVGERVAANAGASHCGSAWTGAFVLYSSTAETDINAPPDVMAVLSKVSLADALGTVRGRVVVCGLAMDYCVLDTACNGARLGFKTVLAIDLARAAHIPGIGKHGSGFLTDPAWFADRVQQHGVQLAQVLE